MLSQERLHNLPAVFIHGNAYNGESFLGVLSLELGKPGDLLFASGTPGRPEIKQYNLASVFPQFSRFARTILQRELRRGLAISRRFNNGTDRRLIGGTNNTGHGEDDG